MSWESRADRIDHSAPEPVWRQVADDLRAQVTSGELAAGARLPSNPELGEIYGVARLTAVKAINLLKDEGLLIVVNGRGTFVARKQT
ncbi:GntR family transcriptional regulator [Amycolatopsis methanolica]|uniref:GntR family transcriptional regulator n=1 Tax=Amycolatopsis methanolica TaxID=1814 RepID=UPI00341462AF